MIYVMVWGLVHKLKDGKINGHLVAEDGFEPPTFGL